MNCRRYTEGLASWLNSNVPFVFSREVRLFIGLASRRMNVNHDPQLPFVTIHVDHEVDAYLLQSHVPVHQDFGLNGEELAIGDPHRKFQRRSFVKKGGD
jgi:hypothetical protein